MTPADFRRALDLGAAHLRDNDLGFFRRVWAQSLDTYRHRLRRLGFTGHGDVLDAGSGMGQWTLCLAELNERVQAVELSPVRIAATDALFSALSVDNITLMQGSVEALPHADASFDAVFCYGMLMLTDYRRTLRELNRVLRPGGTLYFTADGLGWYLWNILEPRHKTDDYDSRQMAVETLAHTIDYYATGAHRPGEQLLIPGHVMRAELEGLGFDDIEIGPDASLARDESVEVTSFYPPEMYGLENVYEVLATKPPLAGSTAR